MKLLRLRNVALLLTLALNLGLGCSTPQHTDRQIAARRTTVQACELPLQGLPRPSFAQSLKIPRNRVMAVRELVAEYGATYRGSDFFEAVNAVYNAILESKGRTLAAAETMAVFGHKLDPFVIDQESELRRTVWFTVGWAVANLEAYDVSDFKVTEDASTHVVHRYYQLQSAFPAENNPAGVVHFKDYPRYAKSYVTGRGAYAKHINGRPTLSAWGNQNQGTKKTLNGLTFRVNGEGRTFMESGGILSFSKYRDIVAQNMWPLYIQHDMRHIHYAYGHARGVSMVFRSARGRNHRRFIMMGAMYEGVDTVQYSHETALAKYMSEKMQMGLEDALLWIAKASKKEITRLIRGAKISITEYQRELADYFPTVTSAYTGRGVTDQGMENELLDYLETSAAHLKDAQYEPYINYHRSAPDYGGSTWDKDFAHYYGMVTMPTPEEASAGEDILPDGPSTETPGLPAGLENHIRSTRR